jgi:hypothetical protein
MPDEPAQSQPEPSQDEKKPTESETKGRPTAEQRFVQRQIVQPLVQLTPLGGSGWLFVDFLLKQEWTQALITFPVMAVTAVWAAYSKSVLDRLSEVAAARGTAHVNIWVGWLKIADEAMKWQLSGFEGKYLQCQGSACESDKPIGLDDVGDGAIKPLLQDIFVPLELTITSQAGGYAKQQRTAPNQEPCIESIWDVLKQVKRYSTYRQMLICAKGGYGKTTLLKHIAYVYSQGVYQRYQAPKLVPFLTILATSWSDLAADNAPDLPEFLTKIHVPSLPEGKTLKLPPNWIAGLLSRGEALVMFDGFDEVPLDRRSAVSAWINRQMWNFPKAIFMITSRPDARADYEQPFPNALLWLQKFSEAQQQKFIRQWYGAQEIKDFRRNTPEVKDRIEKRSNSLIQELQDRPDLADLSSNPLLLNMMCRFHREHEGQKLPQRRVELYQNICEVQLSKRPRGRGIPMCLRSSDQRLEVLQILALAMMSRAKSGDDRGHKQITEHDLLDVIVRPIGERDPEVSARDFLRQMVEVSELLVETQEKGIYEFSHLSFQEFLAASEIGRLKQESMLYDKFAIPAWEATILLYGELVKNPSNLLKAALIRDPDLAYKISQLVYNSTYLNQVLHLDNNFGNQLSVQHDLDKFAATQLDILKEETEKLEKIRQEIINQRYLLLESLIQSGDWLKADEETYRLMIEAVGKEKGDLFTLYDLRNLPCKDLLAIDQLWVNHSQGRFGFSVQQKIYIACGGDPNSEYPDDNAWHKFAERVGWRKNNQWKDKKLLEEKFLDAPNGRFPLRGFGITSWNNGIWGQRAVHTIVSRLLSCSTLPS